MTKQSLADVLRFLVAGFLLCPWASAQAPVTLPQFSADLTMTVSAVEDGDSQATTATVQQKIYSNGERVRIDHGQGAMSTIVDLATHTNYNLIHSQKQYWETDRESAIYPYLRQYDLGNPCASSGKTACKKIGTEAVSGRVCDKWVLTGNNGEDTIWLDRQTHLPIKTVTADGTRYLLGNIHEGPQDASLFVIPSGYRKFNPYAGMGGMFGLFSYSWLLYGPLSWILRIICIVHWFRRRPSGYWWWVFIFFGTVGAVAYVVLEMVPDLGLLRHSFDFVSRNKRIKLLEGTVLDNPSPGNYEELADLYLDAKKYAPARDAFDKAITPRTDYAHLFFGRAQARIQLGDFAGAEDDLRRVYALDPKHDLQRAAGMLAYALFKNGKNEEAEKIFADVIRTSTISEINYNYAQLLIAQGRPSEARESLQRILGKKKTLPVFLKRRERPWFRKASALLKTIPQTASVTNA